MLKIKVITIGKLKEKAFTQLEMEYLKRLRPFAKIIIKEVPEVPYSKESDSYRSRKLETMKIRELLRPGDFVIALDAGGKSPTTLEFAKKLATTEAAGQEIVFVIGGSSGLSDEIKKQAHWMLALSSLTFTHNFARVLLIEQMYRAALILAGKTYDK